MSIADEITRISGARDTIRTKLVNMGLAQSTDKIDDLATAINGIATNTDGTPTATKGAVSNHSVSVTPSVTNTTGYITGSTKTGTAVTVSASELVSGTKSITENGTNIDVVNYSAVDVAVPSEEPVLQAKTNIDPSTSSQTITADNGYDGLSSVQINAMPSGTEGTPTATKGAVSNHAVSVTPSVTNTAGYISGGTKTGTTVSVSASELVSGTKSITSNGTGIDVTNYAAVDVSVTTSAAYTATIMEGRTNHTSCISYNNHSYYSAGSTFTFHAGDTIQCINGNDHGTVDVYYNGTKVGDYDPGWGEIYTFTLPANDIGIWATNNDTKIDDKTPTFVEALSVTANGTYTASSGFAYSPITVSVSGTTPNLQAKTNIDPTTSSQTITADGGYDGLASVQINAMPTMTLPSTASASASGTSKATITPSSSAQYLNIPTGYNATAQYYTIAASGSSKNAQAVQGTTRTNASTLTAIGAVLTVSKTGTYDIYYSAFRTATSTSYTWATQLYIDGAAYGSENTTWTNNQQNAHLTSISLTTGQKLRVYGRETRGTGYYVCAPMLAIVEA